MLENLFLAAVIFFGELPDGFRQVSEADRNDYVQHSDKYVVSEAELGDFCILGKGEIQDSSDDYLSLRQFSFRYGRELKSSEIELERFAYFHQPLFAEVRGQSNFSGFEVDCLRSGKNFWMASGLGSQEITREEYTKCFKSTQCFHPFMGPFLGAADLGMLGFRPKIFNEKYLSAVRENPKLQQKIFQLTIPGVINIDREIVFEKSLPVGKRDFWKNPKREKISETKIKWAKHGSKVVPIVFEFQDSQFGVEKSVKLKLEWSFDKSEISEFLNKENLGSSTFD